MKKLLAISLLTLLLLTQSASAGYPPVYSSGSFINDSTNALTTTSLAILPANNARKYLFLENISAVNICCNPFGVAVCGTAPTFTLVPNGTWGMGGNFVWQGALQCIAASSSSISLVAYEGQ